MPVQAKMVNGRVSADTLEAASDVLKRNGLTVSAFIRNSLDFVAKTGEVPESGCGSEGGQPRTRSELAGFFRRLDAAPMPGREDFVGMTEDEMVERVRMERYGY